MNEDGNFGEGVYCIEAEDLNSLKSVLELESFKDNGFGLEYLVVIEFQYSGDYLTFKPIMRNYTNEKWIILNEKINCEQILKVTNAVEYIN